MNTAETKNYIPARNRKNCGRPLALFGAAVLFLALNAFSVWADDTFDESLFPHKFITPPATNTPQRIPVYLSPGTTNSQATNVTQAGFTNSMEALDDKHKLAIGDVISFQIVEDGDDPSQLVVNDSGDLEVPYLGQFPAENKTCRQLALELKAALEKTYYYQATVIIAVDSMARSRGKVYLVGAVRAPGPQDLPSDEVLTVSKAILRAGGFTDTADQHHVTITRQEGEGNGETNKLTIVVDVGQIFDEGETEKDVPLKPDDLIYIPERLINF